MYPVLTFLRHKYIVAAIGAASVLHKITNGKRPKFLFSRNTEIKYVGSKVKILEQTEDSVTIAKFNEKGEIDNSDFKIMSATDLHLDPGKESANNKSIDRIVKQVMDNKPDLFIFTGDVIESDFQQIDCVQLSWIFEKLGVYFCYTYGNHETREPDGYFKYLMLKGLQYYPHCLSKHGKKELFGYGNCAVHIKNADNTLAKSIYLFDSGRDMLPDSHEKYGSPEGIDGYDFLKPDQIEWYLNDVKKNKEKYGSTKTLCYMHIAVPEYEEVFSGTNEDGFKPTGKAEILYGEQYETVGCSPYNSGFFEKATEEGSLQGLFAGHDHINDFCAIYKGVYLTYTQPSGYSCYSMMDKFGWPEEKSMHGVTLTTLNADGSIKIEQKLNNVYLK